MYQSQVIIGYPYFPIFLLEIPFTYFLGREVLEQFGFLHCKVTPSKLNYCSWLMDVLVKQSYKILGWVFQGVGGAWIIIGLEF